MRNVAEIRSSFSSSVQVQAEEDENCCGQSQSEEPQQKTAALTISTSSPSGVGEIFQEAMACEKKLDPPAGGCSSDDVDGVLDLVAPSFRPKGKASDLRSSTTASSDAVIDNERSAIARRRSSLLEPGCRRYSNGSGQQNKPTLGQQPGRRRSSLFARRHSSVTFAPPLVGGYRHDYALGDTARSISHMIVEPTPEKATKAADTLEKHDFAFVRRSDGSFSYASLVDRTIDPRRGRCMTFAMDPEGSTKIVCKRQWSRFVRLVSTADVVDGPGDRADLPAPAEASGNACKGEIAASAALYRREEMPAATCRTSCGDDDASADPRAPVSVVAFAPRASPGGLLDEDECSMMSSVSDRARLRSARACAA